MISPKRRLSQTLGQLKKGFPCDTFEGGFPTHQVFNDPVAGANTNVHAGISLTTAEQSVTSGITSPDFYRCLNAVGDAATVSGTLTVHGTDWADRVITEQFVLNGASVVSGMRPFKTVTKIVAPAQGTAGDSVSVGSSNRFGLYRPLVSGVQTLELLKVEGTAEAAADVDGFTGEYSTFIPTTAPDGAKIFELDYLTDVF